MRNFVCFAWPPCTGILPAFTIKEIVDKVVPRIAFDFDKVGLQLDIEPYVLANIAAEQSTPERKCLNMFQRWKNGEKGTGGQPRAWETILHAVGKAIGREVQKEIEQDISANVQSSRKYLPAE